LDEVSDNSCDLNLLNDFLQEIDNSDSEINRDFMVPHMINYHENFTIKELLLICDYYGIGKELRTRKNKCTKDIIIHYLVEFEANPANNHIVFKRQNLWFYMNELKNDKFMKKYLLW
jgi:hypothetical protein